MAHHEMDFSFTNVGSNMQGLEYIETDAKKTAQIFSSVAATNLKLFSIT